MSTKEGSNKQTTKSPSKKGKGKQGKGKDSNNNTGVGDAGDSGNGAATQGELKDLQAQQVEQYALVQEQNDEIKELKTQLATMQQQMQMQMQQANDINQQMMAQLSNLAQIINANKSAPDRNPEMGRRFVKQIAPIPT